MNSLYVVLGIALTAVSLLTVVFQIGRKVGRVEEHLDTQDEQMAALHDKVDKLGGLS